MKITTDKELVVSYSALNHEFKLPRLMYIAGKVQDPDFSIDSPADSNLTIQRPDVEQQDPLLFSYSGPDGDNIVRELRILLAKVYTDMSPAGITSNAKYSVIMPSNDGKYWRFRTKDITLWQSDVQVAGNPHGVVQIQDTLYILDYDNRKIWLAGVAELDGAKDNDHLTLTKPPIDLSILPSNAQGQALIYLKSGEDEYLFALYIRSTVTIDSEGKPNIEYLASILVRLKKNTGSGAFEYVDQKPVGRNAQEIIPVTNADGGVHLLIPAIGGMQNYTTTNGGFSEISIVDAPFAPVFGAETLITGDDAAAAPSAASYDITAIAAQAQNGGIIYILTFTFNEADYSELYWRLYKTNVTSLIYSEARGLTLSELETAGVLQVAAEGLAESHDPGSPGLFYWDIFYVNGVNGVNEDLLVFHKNGILITSAVEYDDHGVYFGMGMGPGKIGNDNINSLIIPCEVIRQIAAGFSGKRGLKPLAPHLKAARAQAKAAQARGHKSNALKAPQAPTGEPEPEERR